MGNKKWEWEADESEVPHRGIMSMQYDPLHQEWVFVTFIEKPVFVPDLGRFVDLWAPALVRRDTTMELISYHEYGPYSYHGYMGTLETSHDGGWVAAGDFTCLTEESPNNDCNVESGRVLKLSNDGTLEWSVIDTALYHPELGSQSHLSGVVESPTGSIYAVGWANNYNGEEQYRAFGWLLKITADGCVDTLCTTTSLLEQLRDGERSVKVYPNPASDHLIFEILEDAYDLRVEVFDLQGRRLSTKVLQRGVNVLMLDERYALGMYVWRVVTKTGGILDAGKVVVTGG